MNDKQDKFDKIQKLNEVGMATALGAFVLFTINFVAHNLIIGICAWIMIVISGRILWIVGARLRKLK